MESKFFKNLFVVSADDFLSNKDNEKYFIFQGSKDWDIYLSDKPNSIEYSTLEDVNLLSFKEKNEFLQYMKNIDLIDYSLEHTNELDMYFILVNGNENQKTKS